MQLSSSHDVPNESCELSSPVSTCLTTYMKIQQQLPGAAAVQAQHPAQRELLCSRHVPQPMTVRLFCFLMAQSPSRTGAVSMLQAENSAGRISQGGHS